MTPTETTTILRQFNDWRRGGDIEQPGPLAVGEAIDAAIEMIERLEAAESEAIEQARLNGMGAERELALMAKLEVAEKERDAAIELLDKAKSTLHQHHKNAMCEGCDHSHPLTQLRLSAYQQSKLYADTVSVLEETK